MQQNAIYNRFLSRLNIRLTMPGLMFWTFLLGVQSNLNAAEWQSANVQILQGSDYESLGGAIDDKEKTVFTLELANGWKYGDNFFFLDTSNPTSANTNHYAEFSPRFSFGKITGSDLSFGIVKDVLLAATWEMGEGVQAFLVGVGFALDLPGFAFADLNIYTRDSNVDAFGESASGGQVTIDWLYPFSIGSTKWAFEGFADFAYGEDGGANPKEDNIVAGPRLLVDIGHLWGAPGTVQFGIEHQIWRNKFGIKDVNEDVTQIMLKWIM